MITIRIITVDDDEEEEEEKGEEKVESCCILFIDNMPHKIIHYNNDTDTDNDNDNDSDNQHYKTYNDDFTVYTNQNNTRGDLLHVLYW